MTARKCRALAAIARRASVPADAHEASETRSELEITSFERVAQRGGQEEVIVANSPGPSVFG